MTKISDALAKQTHIQVRALITELETRTIIDWDQANQGILYHRNGSKIWKFGFPANPVGTPKKSRSLLMLQLYRSQPNVAVQLYAEFQHPFTLTMVPIGQTFDLTEERADPALMFVNPDRTDSAKNLLGWALSEYDDFHIRGYLKQSSILQPDTPAPKFGALPKKPSIK